MLVRFFLNRNTLFRSTLLSLLNEMWTPQNLREEYWEVSGSPLPVFLLVALPHPSLTVLAAATKKAVAYPLTMFLLETEAGINRINTFDLFPDFYRKPTEHCIQKISSFLIGIVTGQNGFCPGEWLRIPCPQVSGKRAPHFSKRFQITARLLLSIKVIRISWRCCRCSCLAIWLK